MDETLRLVQAFQVRHGGVLRQWPGNSVVVASEPSYLLATLRLVQALQHSRSRDSIARKQLGSCTTVHLIRWRSRSRFT